MDLRRAISTKLSVSKEIFTALMTAPGRGRLLDKQDIAILADQDCQPGEVLLIDNRCHVVYPDQEGDWHITPLQEPDNHHYRCEYLVAATHMHFYSDTIH